ncbi:type VI secretion system protein TssA [Pseudoduganella danionis]|uniref:Type VI secretion system protein TssA n=1 Tax=Pseudoduganella danionis TaxID=1890295 RepID=A0ABW9SMX7_9BURK|nr:type VI secretion system protein TssA [Pseudoduganella danionis]MTW33533.1 type VI secretion system protein TssA [Pseudoduganella danionis]
MLNISQLLQPVSEERRCGDDLTYSNDMDQIARARMEDDPALDQGVWVTTLRQADWPLVAGRCAVLIETRSKDMRLAVWLAEALAQTQGPRGLGDGLAVLAGLCEQFWDGLYPLADDGDFDERIGNLRWLVSRIPALMCVWQREHGPVPRSDADYCAAMLQQLEQVSDRRLGSEGPSFAAAHESVQTMEVLAQEEAVTLVPLVPETTTTGMQVGDGGPIRNRQQALGDLRRVAAYFRLAEPHSPVAYLAEKAASWGEMPLHGWLREVVKDGSQLAQLETMLGVASTG